MKGLKRSVLAAALATSGAAHAQDRPPAVDDVAKCRGIDEDKRRLQCFDAAAARLDAAVNSKQITVLDREGVRRARRSLFGFSVPSVGLFADKGDREQITEVDGKLTRVLPMPNGRYELVLEDGARWLTIESARWAPDVGAKVHIKKAALGSYWIAVERGSTIRGRRVG